MTAKFRSSGLPPSRITQGQSPPTRLGAGPSFLPSPVRARLHIVSKPWTRIGRTARSALLAPFAPANGGDHVGGHDRKQLAATGGVAGPSMAPMRKPICRPAPSAIAASRPCGFIPISSIATTMASTASRHWSPPLPAMTAPSRGYSAPGSIPSVPGKPTSCARAKRLGGSTAGPFASAGPPPARPCLPARASKPFYRWSPPSPAFMPGGSISGQSRRLRTAPRPRAQEARSSPAIMTWKAGMPRTVFSAVAWNAGIPSIVIVPEHSDFNDDLIAFGEETLAARIAPLIQAPSPGKRWKRGVGVGE